MRSSTEPPTRVDIDACAAEPIRIPGGIQPHGALLVISAGGAAVLQASANIEAITGQAVRPGLALAACGLAELVPLLSTDNTHPRLRRLALGGRALDVGVHATDQGVLVELEPAAGADDPTLEDLYPRIRSFLEQVGSARDLDAITAVAVREIRDLTGFNRVLLYSFDASGVGAVLAEDGDGVLPAYLNLRFPADDIPAQARELYVLNRLRMIPDAAYAPVALEPSLSPVDGQPLDLGQAALRAVSPVHLEYMRNMGTYASMSISIVVEGRLWGLVSGHSRNPRRIGPQVRSACGHLGEILSLQIEAREQARRTAEALRLRQVQAAVLTRAAAAANYADGLAAAPDAWEAVAGAAGAALVAGETLLAVGQTPPDAAVRQIAERLFADGATEVAIDSLAARWPDTAAFAAQASGLLAVSISQIHPHYLMWFRPEVVRTVHWAGEPQKSQERGERLHPRKSFELWKEQVRDRALPWSAEEIDSARDFRTAIQNFVLRRAEERAELTSRLAATNAELESFSYSISHDLRAPFRHVMGFAELLGDHLGPSLDATATRYLENIKEAALSAGGLVDDLLSFSQLGRHSVRPTRIDMDRMVSDLRRAFEGEAAGRRIAWDIAALPPAWGDPSMIRQALQNLIDNAVKYSQPREHPRIEIRGEDTPEATRYVVRDNGVGFDMAYAHKLFAVFQRLHRAEDFEGSGIGLALVRRIVDRHSGDVSVEAELDRGAAFTLTLPKRARTAPGDEPVG